MTRGLLLLGTLALAGCASVNPKPAFDDLGKRIEDRTGQASRWVRSDAEAEAVETALKDLLAAELTSDRAVAVAFMNNASLQATFEDLGIARADFAQATRLANPELSLQAVPPSSGITEGSLTLDVFNVLLQPARKRLGAVELEQTKLRVGDEMLRLAADTKKAFYTYQAREQLVGRLSLLLDIAKAGADLATRQHAAGNVSDLDLVNQSAAYDEARAELARAQAEARVDRERLNRLMGLWGPYTEWKAGDRLPEIPAGETPVEHIESVAIRQRLDVEAARFGVDLVGQSLALKKKTRFFPVGINVGVQTDRQSGEKRVYGPNLAVQLPIFDLGGASIARLESQYRQSRRQLEALAVNARSEAREARDAVTATRDRALFYRNVLLPQRVKILDLTLRQYNMMLKGAYDLLLARKAEVETEHAYIDAWREYWLARVDLERAVGGRVPAAEAANAAVEGEPHGEHEHHMAGENQ